MDLSLPTSFEDSIPAAPGPGLSGPFGAEDTCSPKLFGEEVFSSPRPFEEEEAATLALDCSSFNKLTWLEDGSCCIERGKVSTFLV